MKTLAAAVVVTMLSLVPVQAKAALGAGTQGTQSNAADPCTPPAVVVSFLNFTPAQAAQFQELLSEFLPTVQGLQQQITVLQNQLNILLNQPNPNPVAVGNVTLQIHVLEQQVAQAIQDYQNLFVGLLSDAQKEKVQAVTQASQLQPVVPAFVALKLAPPPTPLPCQQ
jgi:hypothetical protein